MDRSACSLLRRGHDLSKARRDYDPPRHGFGVHGFCQGRPHRESWHDPDYPMGKSEDTQLQIRTTVAIPSPVGNPRTDSAVPAHPIASGRPSQFLVTARSRSARPTVSRHHTWQVANTPSQQLRGRGGRGHGSTHASPAETATSEVIRRGPARGAQRLAVASNSCRSVGKRVRPQGSKNVRPSADDSPYCRNRNPSPARCTNFPADHLAGPFERRSGGQVRVLRLMVASCGHGDRRP